MSRKDNIHVVSRAVIIDQDNILLCKTADLKISYYYLPGGHVEHLESAEKALVRELIEETGVECKIKRFLGCLEHSFEEENIIICNKHEYDFVFEVESDIFRRNNKIISPESKIELVWMPFSKLSEIDLRPECYKKMISEWLKTNQSQALKSTMK